jgi:hypothetical protein
MRRHVVFSHRSWIPLHPQENPLSLRAPISIHARSDGVGRKELGSRNKIKGITTGPVGGYGNGGEQSFRDDLSVIFGKVGTVEVRMFEESLWP